MLPTAEESVYIEVKGDKTHQLYKGEFVFKTALTNMEILEIAKETARIIGPNPLPPNYTFFARSIAELAVRVKEAPKFWKESLGGRLLQDPNVVDYVYGKALEAAEAYQKKIDDEAAKVEEANKKAEEAKPKEQEA